MKQRIEEGPLYKLPMSYRHYRGVEWEIVDDDSTVWAITYSERSAEAITDAINQRAATMEKWLSGRITGGLEE